jgi:type I restriction enzyme S subunit
MILNDVCEFIVDTEHKTAPNVDIGIPSIRTPNVGKGRLILDKDIKYVDEPTFVEWTRRGIPQKGDLIIAREAPVGNVAIVPDVQLCLGQRTVLVRPNNSKANSSYLCYYLLSPKMQYKMLAGSGGSTVAHLNMKDVRNLELEEIHPLPTQSRIASILSAYDDLIENNLKRIKLLEAKAFLRYKQIVKDEKMEVEDKLENLIQTVKRKAKIPKADFKEKGDFPIIDQSTDFIGGYTNEKEVVYEDLPMIVFGDHTRILKYINFPFACGADGTQLVKPNNPSISVAYLYFELISCNLSNYHYARHFKFLKEQVIKLPSEKVMVEYKEETDKIFNLIQLLRIQNTKLREARDILLPKLMNGQIEV